jgi:NAD(P)-dependent dehydrogenase (short-subunit alcohol dehydrogenase family)
MTSPNEFEGKPVVVTGGTGALGRSVVGGLLARGASVHIPVMHARELDGFPYADRVRCQEGVDLRDEGSCAAFYGSVPGALYGSIHLAGGFSMGPFTDTSLAEYQKLVDLNVTTCFLSCREALKRMTGEGRIVNVAAKPALVPTGGSWRMPSPRLPWRGSRWRSPKRPARAASGSTPWCPPS